MIEQRLVPAGTALQLGEHYVTLQADAVVTCDSEHWPRMQASIEAQAEAIHVIRPLVGVNFAWTDHADVPVLSPRATEMGEPA